MVYYSRGLVHSQVDGGLREEATKSCSMAAQIAKKHVPSQIVDVLKLQVSNVARRGSRMFSNLAAMYLHRLWFG